MAIFIIFHIPVYFFREPVMRVFSYSKFILKYPLQLCRWLRTYFLGLMIFLMCMTAISWWGFAIAVLFLKN